MKRSSVVLVFSVCSTFEAAGLVGAALKNTDGEINNSLMANKYSYLGE